MGSVKHPNFSEQHHRHAAAFSLTDLRTQLLKHGLNVTPLNIGAGWPCKDQSEGALVFAFHGLMVLFYGTYNKSCCSVRCPIFVLKNPLAIHQHGFEVVVRVKPFIPKASIPHLQIHHHFRCFVEQPVSVAHARRTSRQMVASSINADCGPSNLKCFRTLQNLEASLFFFAAASASLCALNFCIRSLRT